MSEELSAGADEVDPKCLLGVDLATSYVAALRSAQTPDPRYLSTLTQELDDDLESYCVIAEAVHKFFAKDSSVEGAGTRQRTLPRRLQDVELQEVVGSGSFGTVYLAYDYQLDRLVAAKVLHPWILRRDRERMYHEARSVSRLRHASIVAVHGIVGHEDEQAIVYDYIDGMTLKEWLEIHQLTARQAAEIVTQLADALAYAHSEGVVHLDVKPSNILLDLGRNSDAGPSDMVGQAPPLPRPVLVDFGLARVEGKGGFGGTPAYMSPEQASRDQRAIDRRSDIYSLAVVFHQLLVGELPPRPSPEPPGERDQNSAIRLRDAKNIPQDLQAICVRALAIDPAKRFQTANEFSDELRRWLAGEPIRSRRVGVGERFGLWCRRKPLAASFAALAVCSFVVGFAAVTWQWRQTVREYERAEVNLADALVQKTAAERSFQLGFAAVDDFLTRVSEERLLLEPGFQGLRKDLLEKALVYYKRFTDERHDDPMVLTELAAAHQRTGQILDLIGTSDEALLAHQEALRLRQSLLQSRPADAALRRDLAISHGMIARIHAASGRYDDAFQSLEQAEREFDGLTRRFPESHQYKIDLGKCLESRGLLTLRTNPGGDGLETLLKANSVFEEVLDHEPDNIEFRATVAASCVNVGYAQAQFGNTSVAIDSFRRARDMLRPVVPQRPAETRYARTLASSLNNMAELQRRSGHLEQAGVSFGEALELGEQLARHNPQVTTFQDDLASTCMNLSLLHVDRKDFDSAQALVTRAVDIRDDLARRDSSNLRRQESLARTLDNLANLEADRGQHDNALQRFERALQIRKRLSALVPEDTDYQRGAARTAMNLGDLQREMELADDAAANLTFARESLSRLVESQPLNPDNRYLLGLALQSLGRLAAHLHKFDEAAQLLRTSISELAEALKQDGRSVVIKRALLESYRELLKTFLAVKNFDQTKDLVSEWCQACSGHTPDLLEISKELATGLKSSEDASTASEAEAQARTALAGLAIEVLREAIEHGLPNADSVLNDDVFDPIRNDPRFEKLSP